jgi:molybdopterin-guanine dinucleotide biosynthesis protein A
MGTDKARLEIDGVPLADRAAAVLEAAGAAPVVLVGPDQKGTRAQWPTVDDRFPGQGPMGGVISALGSIDAALVAAVACDMPALDVGEIERLREAIGTADVAISVAAGVDQPLHAVWSLRALPVLLAAFDDGERSLRRALRLLGVVRIPAGDAAHLVDIDTPEDLRSYLARR